MERKMTLKRKLAVKAPARKAGRAMGLAKARATFSKIKSVKEARDRQARLTEERAKKTLTALRATQRAAAVGGVKAPASPRAAKEPQAEAPPTPPTPEVLSHVHAFVSDVAGRDGLRVVKAIGDEGTTDEVIEKRTKLKIAQVRSLLNHLHSYGIVEYGREKNLQSGWFTYTWRVNANRAFSNFLINKRREYEELRKQHASMDAVQIYRCKKDCDGLPFERALELSFKCPSCRQALSAVDPAAERARITERLNAVQKILSVTTERDPGRSLQMEKAA